MGKYVLHRMRQNHQRLQLLAQLAEVVNLAIEDDLVAKVGGGHGLMAFGTQVQNGEPTVAEPHRGIFAKPTALVVGTAMSQAIAHHV